MTAFDESRFAHLHVHTEYSLYPIRPAEFGGSFNYNIREGVFEMKVFVEDLDEEALWEMTNANPQKADLKVVIWSEHGGVARKVGHNEPRI